ncbi:MAG: carboxypeptidase-like regulatory domain-containing protein, partial [bacterium]
MYKKFCFFEGKVIVLTLVLIFLVTGNVLAGTTGKIAGKVIDQKTGEPLIGANVVIVGTTMGASTDNDGFYFIINVPPGNYSVTTSYIGYEMLTQSEVLVNVDRTTTLDFALTPEAVELGAVTVLAERPIIEQDVTGSTEILDTGYIERLPIIDLKDITRLQSGIYYTGETTYMRAGLATEVNYHLDGTSLNSGLLSDN